MKAAILTMFTGLSPTYSLVNVAADQIRMLLDAGMEVRMLVSETCPDRERTGIFRDPRVEWVRVTNTLHGAPITWYDYSGSTGRVHDSFFEEADRIARDLVRHLEGVDFCLMHDILYQGWHLVHNIAVRKAQEQLPGVRFVEFTHSLPLPHPEKMTYPFSARFTGMPNTRFVYPTQSGIPALARQYDIPETACAVVNNALPMLEWAGPEVRAVARSMDLSEKEVLIVCPGRLTPAKRFEKAAMLAGAVKTASGKSMGLIFCDFPSADLPAPVYKSMIRTEGKKAGLSDGDLLFTSDPGFPDGFPRAAVLELFGLSNLFLCPSFSESFGLPCWRLPAAGTTWCSMKRCRPCRSWAAPWAPVSCAGTPTTSASTPGSTTPLRSGPTIWNTAPRSPRPWTATRRSGPRRRCAPATAPAGSGSRSEERRVGKECRSRWSPYH